MSHVSEEVSSSDGYAWNARSKQFIAVTITLKVVNSCAVLQFQKYERALREGRDIVHGSYVRCEFDSSYSPCQQCNVTLSWIDGSQEELRHKLPSSIHGCECCVGVHVRVCEWICPQIDIL